MNLSEHTKNYSTAQIHFGQISPRDFMRCFVELEIQEKILPKLANILKEQRGWVKIRSKNVFFHHQTQCIFPDFSTFQLGNCHASRVYNPLTFRNKFEDYTGDLIKHDEFMQAFSENFDFLEETFHFKLPDRFSVAESDGYISRDGNRQGTWGKGGENYPSHIPVFRLPREGTLTFPRTLLQLILEGLMPSGLSPQDEQSFRFILKARLCHKEMFTLQNGKFAFNEPIIDQELLKLLLPDMQLQPLSKVDFQYFGYQFLDTEKRRINGKEYSQADLTDPSVGHWDLWDLTKENMISVELTEPLIARNPIEDIRENTVVAIDLGTRKTVVAIQSAQDKPEIREFPTVLEVFDIQGFQQAYEKKQGRPPTSWSQITTADTAFQHFLNSENYHAFLHELKPWIGESQRSLYLRDGKNKNLLLPSYQQLPANACDFLEISAYYLGLSVNTMSKGIHFQYLLSYPNTYTEELKKKFLASFTKGIRKSLPSFLLQNEEIMSNLQIDFLASEALSYAACVLQEYGFVPKAGEKICYGIFDFGGGTSDFDFGFFSTGVKKEFAIQSLGSGAAPFFGGESILELLAFHLAKANQDLLVDNNLPLECPSLCEDKGEAFIAHNKTGKRNLLLLKEYLRNVWENFPHANLDDVEINLYQKGSVKVSNLPFKLPMDTFEELIRSRFEEAIQHFFLCLMDVLTDLDPQEPVQEMHLFFSGDSSKSEIFHQVFEEYSKQYSKQILSTDERNFFKLYPALDNIPNSLANCKTGVALGLLHCSPLGNVEIIENPPKT